MNASNRPFFDKPIVSPSDFEELGKLFIADAVSNRARYLGGIPNVSIQVASANTQLAVRVCNNGYTSPAHLELELATLQYLNATGFAVAPIPIPGRDGQLVQEWHGYRAFATEFIEGRSADEVDITPAHCEHLGQLIAELTTRLRAFSHPVSPEVSYWSRSARLLDLLSADPIHEAWDLDMSALHAQWRSARDDLRLLIPGDGFIHTDIWPPNVLIVGERIVGIIDFDDMAWGPPFLDLAAAVGEFAVSSELELDGEKFGAMVSGFRAAGGIVGDREMEALLPAITVCYASWLACNALHQVPFLESVTYVERLVALQSRVVRSRFTRELKTAIGGGL